MIADRETGYPMNRNACAPGLLGLSLLSLQAARVLRIPTPHVVPTLIPYLSQSSTFLVDARGRLEPPSCRRHS
jgi:hypothetical protein